MIELPDHILQKAPINLVNIFKDVKNNVKKHWEEEWKIYGTSKCKNSISESKNTMDGIKSTFHAAEEEVGELEDTETELSKEKDKEEAL